MIATGLMVGRVIRERPVKAIAGNATPGNPEARSVLARAKTEALTIPNQYSRDEALDRVAAEEAREGDLDGAIDTANQVKSLSKETCQAIGNELANRDEWESVASHVSKLDGSKDLILMALVSRLAALGKIDQALRASVQIVDGYYRANAISSVALRQAEKGNDASARKAMAMASHVSAEGPIGANDVNLQIVEGQLLRGDTKKAHVTVNSITTTNERAHALVAGARILWNRSDRTNAAAWLNEGLKIEDEGMRGRSQLWKLNYSLPLHWFALPLQVRLGRANAAMRYAEGLEASLRLHDLNLIAIACVEIGDKVCVDKAVEKIWSLPLPQGRSAADFGKIQAVESVASTLADRSEFDEAQRLFTVLQYRPDRTDAPYLGIAVLRARQGDFENAVKWALWVSSDPSGSPRSDALRRIALLETKKSGPDSCRGWVAALTENEDRAYALLGIAQGISGEDDRKPHRSEAGDWTMSADEATELKDPAGEIKTTSQSHEIDSASVGTPKPSVGLHTGESRFRITIQTGGQTMTMKLSTIIADNGGNWTATDLLETAWGVATDTATIEKGSLILLKRNMAQGTAVIDLDFGGNKATGKVTVDGKDQPVAVDLGGPLFADGAGADEVLACLPLAVGYSASFRNFDARLQKVTLKQLNVAALEAVKVPAGTFEAFRVEVVSTDGGTDTKTLWISKDSRKVVKVTAAYSSVNGTATTQELTE